MSSDPIVTATVTDAQLASLAGLAEPAAQPTPFREFWRHFSANAGAVGGLVIVITVLLIAVFAGVLAAGFWLIEDFGRCTGARPACSSAATAVR